MPCGDTGLCRSLLHMSSAASLSWVQVGTQVVPRDNAVGRVLNTQHALSRDALLSVDPLPYSPLRDANLLGELGLGEALGLDVPPQLSELRGDGIGFAARRLFALHLVRLAKLVPEWKPSLVADDSGQGNDRDVNKSRPKPGEGISTEVKQEEGRLLGNLWKRLAKRSQGEFAAKVLGSTQGNFSHYVGGRRPITLEVAEAIAAELQCQIREFSPRLAAEKEAIEAAKRKMWPFRTLEPDAFSGVSLGKLLSIEGLILQELEKIPTSADAGKKKGKSQAGGRQTDIRHAEALQRR